MAKKINIAELSIDDKALLKSTQEIKKQLDAIKQEQKQLQKEGLSSSKVFIQNAGDIKVLSKAYNENLKTISKRTQAQAEAETREEQLTIALNLEAETIEGLRNQNKLLNKLRNSANILTAEGAKELELLNAKLDENNEKIKDNVDAYTQQKINIGNYTDSIKEAFDEINIFNGGLSGFIQRSQEAGGAGNLVSGALSNIAKGFIGATKSALAFLATPIGAVLGAIGVVIGLVINGLNRSEESTNKLKRAIAPLTGLFNKLLGALEPVGEFLIDGIVKSLEFAEVALYSALEALADGLEFLGFEDTANSLKKFNAEIIETSKSAKKLADAEAEFVKNQRKARLVTLEYQKEAEKLRQIRDDESLSIKDRIQANEELGAKLTEQIQTELALAEQALALTDLRIEQEGKTSDLLDERAERLIEIADIQERITGQESEQLTNRNALLKEAGEKEKERAEARITKAEQALALLKEQRRFDIDNLATQQKIAKEEIKILNQKLNDKLISETEYQTEVLRIKNDLVEKQKETEQAELDRIQEFEDRKRELTEAIALKNEEDEEQKRLLALEQQFQRDIEELERLQLTETEKTELLALLETQRGEAIRAIQQEFLDAKVQAELEANKKLIESDQITNQVRQGLARILTNTLTGLLGDTLGARLASIALESAIQAGLVKLESASASARVSANIATANAQAVAASPLTAGLPFTAVNTAQGIALQAGIKASATQAITRIIASGAIRGIGTIASGFKAEDGGIFGISGPSHANGGVPIFAGNQYIGEAEGNEGIGILNRSAFSSFLDFNNAFRTSRPQAGKFESGAVIEAGRRIGSTGSNFSEQIERVLANLPNPVVTVEDIDRGFTNKAIIENGANT